MTIDKFDDEFMFLDNDSGMIDGDESGISSLVPDESFDVLSDEDQYNDMLTMDETEFDPFDATAFRVKIGVDKVAKFVENKFIALLRSPKYRKQIPALCGYGASITATADIEETKVFRRMYASAVKYNKALSVYPKLVKALEHKAFHTDLNNELQLKVSKKAMQDIILPCCVDIDESLCDESPIVMLLLNVQDLGNGLEEQRVEELLNNQCVRDIREEQDITDMNCYECGEDLNLPVIAGKNTLVPPLEDYQANSMYIDDAAPMNQATELPNYNTPLETDKYPRDFDELMENGFDPNEVPEVSDSQIIKSSLNPLEDPNTVMDSPFLENGMGKPNNTLNPEQQGVNPTSK